MWPQEQPTAEQSEKISYFGRVVQGQGEGSGFSVPEIDRMEW